MGKHIFFVIVVILLPETAYMIKATFPLAF